jgi:IclR family transcriptional regulator, pca regulon regulatory protein
MRPARKKSAAAKSASAGEVYPIGGLLRGLALLETLTAARKPMKLVDLARALDLTRGVAFRLIFTLKQAGYLQEIAGSKIYQPTPRVLSLGFAYLRSLNMLARARPHLEALGDATRFTVYFGVLDGADVVYLDCYRPRGQATLDLDIGDRTPAHATAMGRVLLAELSSAELAASHAEATMSAFKLPKPKLPTLVTELAAIRVRGYAVTSSALYKGVTSIAAPVRDSGGRAVASINCTILESLDKAEIEGKLRQKVVAAARAISAALGHG